MKRKFGAFAVMLALAVGIGVSQTSASSARTSSEQDLVGSAATVKVPNVVGFRMDRATRTLHDRRLRVNEECSGLFGCIVKSRWWVCQQSPRAGRYVRRYSVVVIYAERRGEC